MPDVFVTMNGMPAVLTIGGNYKPGDPPPIGYSDWHEWAAVQHKAGLRQKTCSRCGKYKYPQEIARTVAQHSVKYRTKRDCQMERNPIAVTETVAVCKDCDQKLD